MTRQQLDWFLDSIWKAGVAYGRLVPGRAVSLSEADILAIRDESFSRIKGDLAKDQGPAPLAAIIRQSGMRLTGGEVKRRNAL